MSATHCPDCYIKKISFNFFSFLFCMCDDELRCLNNILRFYEKSGLDLSGHSTALTRSRLLGHLLLRTGSLLLWCLSWPFFSKRKWYTKKEEEKNGYICVSIKQKRNVSSIFFFRACFLFFLKKKIASRRYYLKKEEKPFTLLMEYNIF